MTETPTPLRAYRGDAALKAALLVEIGKHEAAHALIKRAYEGTGSTLPDGFKGCAIGCALHSLNTIEGVRRAVSDHARFPSELGIPIELAYHIDTLFEDLTDEESQTWPRRVIDAIPVGADLSGVVPVLLQWMILDPQKGVISLAKPEFHDTYREFATLVARNWVVPDSVTLAEWDAIDTALGADAVWAWTGAWARAWAWTGSWAWAWARAGARARAGAWAGAGARAGARAWAYSQLSAKTLRLLQTAPIPGEVDAPR